MIFLRYVFRVQSHTEHLSDSLFGCLIKTLGTRDMFKVADLSPVHFRKQTATDGTKLDLNIGFHQGLAALIQGPPNLQP